MSRVLVFFAMLIGARLVNGAEGAGKTANSVDKPNIVYILADDLGYGSVNCYGASKDLVRTPNIDGLAQQGVRFTDANTPASICTPTRYGILTGRYPWRTRLKWGVVSVGESLLPDTERATLASWLKGRGYRTASIGKWHLGYTNKRMQPEDWTEPLRPGPLELGYDYHFAVPQNHGDYTGIYIENDHIYGLESNKISPYSRTFYGRQYMGFDAPQRVNKNVMATLTNKAVAWLDKQSADQPFFLYFAPVAVHHPTTPSDRMRGESNCGAYGDFIQDLDLSVGEILNKLDEMGVAENTLVIFTSDNGGEIPGDPQMPEQQAIAKGLEINGSWRGDKHTIWEGGMRVPYIVRWPGRVPEGKTSDVMINLMDSFATITDLLAGEVPSAEQAVPDSFSFRQALLNPGGKGGSTRRSMVTGNLQGILALRRGQWKYIEGKFADGVPHRMRRYHQGQAMRQLYHLGVEPKEKQNILDQFPEVAKLFQQELDAIRDADASRLPTDDSLIGRKLQRELERITLEEIKRAVAQAGPAPDLWAFDKITINKHSKIKRGERFALQHLFDADMFDGRRNGTFHDDRGPGFTIFADPNGGKGSVDFVEWKVSGGPVKVVKIYFSAGHDDTPRCNRSINRLRIIADTDGQAGFDADTDSVLVDDTIKVPYSSPPNRRQLDKVYHLDSPATAQSFRAEFTRARATAPRLMELTATAR